MLSVQDLTVSYGRVEAVRGISLEVPEGGLVTLVGANGAGKSSVINAITGIVRPRAGRIAFRGADVTRTPAHTMVGRGVVQVPEGRQVLATLTIEENLQLGAWRSSGRRITEVYERFPVLAERRGLPAGSLSGGEQQMLAIGRALVAEPTLMLLDEPSMGLAPRVVDEVFAVIAQVRASGTTVLLVEQNARRALEAADYGYVLATGEIAHEGPATELLADDRVVQAYLGAE
uniref:ABC transporter ATP-binding protein n=1 Tax=Ornithinicoccus halotolerans TaxID=1748220 RepID=UPI001295A831|nr:ABC transporter ATP-binding protein [Ornithinicoccus halotolerans]